MAFYQPDNKRSNDNTIITSPPEKGVVEVYEHQGSYDDIDNGPTYDDAQTSRLLRKMDLNIVPFLALLYLWDSYLPSLHVAYVFCADYLSSTELTSVMLALLVWKQILK